MNARHYLRALQNAYGRSESTTRSNPDLNSVPWVFDLPTEERLRIERQVKSSGPDGLDMLLREIADEPLPICAFRST
jgi:hypothetical protein